MRFVVEALVDVAGDGGVSEVGMAGDSGVLEVRMVGVYHLGELAATTLST